MTSRDLSVQAEAVLTTAETIQTALTTVDSVFSGTGGETARELAKLAHLFAGIGEELEIMANTLARLRYFEKAAGGGGCRPGRPPPSGTFGDYPGITRDLR